MQDGSEYIKQQVSLLMMRLWVSTEQGEPEELGDYPDLEALVAPAVIALYKRPDHVAAFGDGCFGFLIRHIDAPQSWLVTRKLMQLANQTLVDSDGRELSATASLKRIDPLADDANETLAIASEALDYVDARWQNKALLVDPRRVLSVYPREELQGPLEQAANDLRRPKAWIINEALSAYFERETQEQRMYRETLEGLADVEAGRVCGRE